MNSLYEKFILLNRSIKDSQFPINCSGIVKAYYGINREGFFRISFLSTKTPEIKGITKNINIVQGESGENSYWTCFDLRNEALLSAFCVFGEDLISCIIDEFDEKRALIKLKASFNIWLALFKKSRTPLSPEKAKGLYGELYFIDNYLLNKYSVEKTLYGWSGPEMYNKDFSIDETWYEIKTINPASTTIKISSLQQLCSDKVGHLIVIRVEEMSDSYKDEKSTINKLCQSIISKINDVEVKEIFLNKLNDIGYDFCDDLGNKNYQVVNKEAYLVNELFPKLNITDIHSDAINNVSYELIIRMIKEYMEEFN